MSPAARMDSTARFDGSEVPSSFTKPERTASLFTLRKVCNAAMHSFASFFSEAMTDNN